VTEHRQLGHPDGGCAGVPAGVAADRLGAVIGEVRPDTVLTFGPDGVTGHPDHRAVSAWATAAVRRTPRAHRPRLLHAAKTEAWCDRFAALNRAVGAFPAGLPRPVPSEAVAVDVVLPDDLLDRKVAALLAQASQVAPLVEAIGQAAFRDWVATECFTPGPGGAPSRARRPAAS
jgi:LmbE family N-acetylglucosaminyl deacetylase